MKSASTCLLLFMFNLSTLATAGVINFGNAEEYIFASASNEQWGGNLLLGSEAHIFGSVAASNTMELGDGAIIDGDACATPSNATNWGATVAGAIGVCTNFTQLANDISSAAAEAKMFTGSDLEDVTESTKIFGRGFQSFIINDLLLAGGETLAITGSVTDYFVFNIFGAAMLGSGANILLQGGVAAENVIFNFVANSASHTFELGGANISGTFLSSGRTFIIGDGATLNNSRFFSTESIVANVQDVRFPKNTVPQVPVTEPSTLIIFAAGAMGLALYRFKKQS